MHEHEQADHDDATPVYLSPLTTLMNHSWVCLE